MSNFPVLKEYSIKHQNEIIDLILHIQQKEYNVAITKDDQPDLLCIKDFYQTGNGNFWVAIQDDTVIGTISLLDIGNQELALRKMFVKKEYRGPKYQVGSRLLNNALRWANEKSIKGVYLGTTPQFVAAHRFYEKNGFESIEIEKLPASFPVLEVDKKFYRYLIS
ncbi:GNAT family N-acetyltransferase [Sporosarcina sp. Marseille-Q4063]|uniref:GNAT family N-acetyltransferase n=1 Tax=Sporosarcina sp. Marseille-Q4063 TaxID=2810514 RepID=UPI001BAE9103|nr:GNAT family N-acetyltransferase [Sporosarcina sp. Marseille-Q4063]QUW21992.1 GNAT family N-acetyltransferase [Sporosarcina sp. Marseille-Q4063]